MAFTRISAKLRDDSALLLADMTYDPVQGTLEFVDIKTGEALQVLTNLDLSAAEIAETVTQVTRHRLIEMPVGIGSGLSQVSGTPVIAGVLPANSVILGVYLRVDHAETQVGGASIFVGLDVNGQNGDAQSFVGGNGLSVTTTGVRMTRLDDGGTPTMGGVMKQSPQDSGGDVEKVPGQYLTDSGTRNVQVTGSGNFTDFAGVLFFHILDLSVL